MSKEKANTVKPMNTACSVRLCTKPAVSSSPIDCQPLCARHIQSDLAQVQRAESAVADRIEHLKKYKEPLRLMLQRLESDLQLLDDTFKDLRDTLDRCQKELVDVITKQHDQLLDSLRTLADQEEFEAEFRAAKEQNDSRKAYLMNESMRKSLESQQMDTQLVCMDEETQQVRMVAYPDIGSRVQDLVFCIEPQIKTLQMIAESLDAKRGSGKNVSLHVKESEERVHLPGKAMCMAMLCETGGFVIDSSDSITRAFAAAGSQPLPQRAVFVAVQPIPGDSPAGPTTAPVSSSESAIHLLFPDGKQRLTLKSSWDSSQPITDLHCDDKRQQLFIAQKQAVTVADLCGEFVSRIRVSELEDGAQEIHCITGNCDKLFMCVTVKDKGAVVFGVSKESRAVQLRFPVTCLQDVSGCRMFVQERMLTLCRETDCYTICTITGQIISSERLGTLNVLGLTDSDDVNVVMAMAKGTIGTLSKQQLQNRIILSLCSLIPFGEMLVTEQGVNSSQVLQLKNGTVVAKRIEIGAK